MKRREHESKDLQTRAEVRRQAENDVAHTRTAVTERGDGCGIYFKGRIGKTCKLIRFGV